MTPKAEHIAIRQLIRRLAATPEGYSQAAAKGRPGADLSYQHASRMLKTGELVRVKVPGHYLRFVKTQAMADALTTALQSVPKRPRKPDKPKGSPPAVRTSPLRRLVVASSAEPGGTTLQQCAHMAKTTEAFYKCVKRLIGLGLLFRAKVAGWPPRYFASQADASAWQAATPPHITPPKPRPSKRTKPLKVAAPKAVKVVKLPKLATRQQIVISKPYSPPAPRRDAVAVYPEKFKFSSRMMADRYAVSLPIQRIGQAGFSMSI